MYLEINVKVAGIPCIAKVHGFTDVKGSFRRDAPSDLDYYGYTEIDYEICDRKGYPAKWLENKLTKESRAELESELTEVVRDELTYH